MDVGASSEHADLRPFRRAFVSGLALQILRRTGRAAPLQRPIQDQHRLPPGLGGISLVLEAVPSVMTCTPSSPRSSSTWALRPPPVMMEIQHRTRG